MKRSYSEQSDLAEDASSSSMFHLKSQNRALALEMFRYKRQLSEARKELDMIRGKSREMESLVSIIQRAWSQLDIDASMLLDGFGDSEHIAETGGNSELLYRLIHAGSSFHSLDPTDINSLPRLSVDEWSTAEDLVKAREVAGRMLDGSEANSNNNSSSSGSGGSGGGGNKGEGKEKRKGSAAEGTKSSNDLDVEFGGKVDETLCAHASFTLSLLERLCFVLSDSGLLDHLPESLGAIADAKGLHAETFALKDRIVKLSGEILDLRAKLHVCEQQRSAAEKTLDRATLEHSRIIANGITPGEELGPPDSSNSSSSGAGGGGKGGGGDLKEMSLKISVLEKQLAESEGAKAKAEMTLTERLARPLSQTEAQVADMRRAMEDLRQQGRQRVASLISEGAALQERVSDLETAMMQIETSSEQKCSEVALAAANKVKAIESEKNVLHSSLFAVQADLAITNQLKLQVGELSILESSARLECQKLQQKIAALSSSQERLHSHLSTSRGRELGYEVRLGIEGSSSSGSNSNGNGNSGHLQLEQIGVINDIESNWRSPSPALNGLHGHPVVTSELDSTLALESKEKLSKDLTESKEFKGEREEKEGTEGGTERIGEGKEGDERIEEPSHIAEIALLTLKAAQERAKETQIELDEARASLNDLILEIESVSVEEGRSREQSARVLRQLTDSQAMQRGVMEENLRLQERAEELQARYLEVESRVDIVQNVMKQQDSLISQLRAAELAARTDVRSMKRLEAEEGSKKRLNEQLLVEAEQKLKLADHSVVTAKKRNTELQSRCDELSTQWETERKLRMEAQRETKPKSVKKEKNGNDGNNSSSSSGHLNHEDAAMLEMTLGMLRCSVCKDRFKEVALTRCFHLFCKECIDENIKNRQRKCPACGEKFGQDDVKSIFFTD